MKFSVVTRNDLFTRLDADEAPPRARAGFVGLCICARAFPSKAAVDTKNRGDLPGRSHPRTRPSSGGAAVPRGGRISCLC